MPRVTLKMIASEAGVSIATVSMALRAQGKLAPENVERIRAVAKRLGYRPDPLLASLASKRFRTDASSQGLPIALLEFPPFASDKGSRVHHYRKALQTSAVQLGYAPQVYTLAEMRRYHDFARLLYHRGTAGIVITGQADLDLFENRHCWDSFSIVQCGRYQSILPLHTVRPNIFQAIHLAFNQAYERGYRRMGFALGQHAVLLEDDLARYGAAMAFIHSKLEAKNRIPPYFGPHNDHDAIVNWVRECHPDVVVSFSTGLWYFLRDAGMRIPEDLGFIALHKHTEQDDEKEIAGLNQSRNDIGDQTMLLIDQMVRHNERGIPPAPRNILIQSSWVDGPSLPARKAV